MTLNMVQNGITGLLPKSKWTSRKSKTVKHEMKTRREHLTVNRNTSTETLQTLQQKHFTLTVKRDTSNAKGKTTAELVLGQKIRLATIKYNDASKKKSLQAEKRQGSTLQLSSFEM